MSAAHKTPSTDDESRKEPHPQPADFETAIETCSFGLFNYLLLLAALPAAIASVFETSTMSYILPSAECDLQLTLLDKGILNAITYAGMITAAIFWGYVADTKGRKKLMVFGFMGDAVCVLGGALSQNVWQLMIFKYFGGFTMCGPFAALMSYLSEMHSKRYRARVMMIIGMMYSLGSMSLPGLALTIMPNQWDIHFLGLTLHSWNIFLATTAIPSLLSSLMFALFPESPKFLMSQGRNDEAMTVFKKIYALNLHKSRDNFPIKELLHEKVTTDHTAPTISTIDINGVPPVAMKLKDIERQAAKVNLHDGLLQLRPLFQKPFLGLSLFVYLMNFCILLGQNTVRLWLPQLFATINEYQTTVSTAEAPSMCTILEYSVNKTSVSDQFPVESCRVVITAASYTNNIIVALAAFVGYIVAGFVVNLIGVNRIIIICLFAAGSSGLLLYWSTSSLTTLILASIYTTMGSISSQSVLSASTNLFPTSLRTMIVSLAMAFGRCGSLIGNILFPTFMALGCIPPFLMVGVTMLSAGLMAAFLPNSNKTTFS